jgi:thymidylate kinase
LNRSPEVRQSPPFMLPPSLQGEMAVLHAVADLFSALNEAGVRYCHWKSNHRLEWGLAGRTDLDLLVDPDHTDAFQRILARFDVKPLDAPPGKAYPGLAHYLGFDWDTGDLFHLHVHYALVLGEQHVKNYSLPLVERFLDSAELRQGVKVPPPDLELVVLSLRALLKYRDRDGVKDLLSVRSPGIPEHIRREIAWLLGRTTLEQVAETLDDLALPLPSGMVLEFLRAVQQDPRQGRLFLGLRRRLRRALRPYQRSTRLQASASYFLRVGRKRLLQGNGPDRQMTLPGRGLMIALVGIDGAGKSTMASKVTQWLSWRLHVPFYYLGSKQPSIWTSASYMLFRMARRSHREISKALGEDHGLPVWIAKARQILLASHYLFVGRDRYRRYRRARREVEAGAVVIFDRYPFEAPLDGPEIRRIDEGRLNAASRFLARLEERLYAGYAPVELLVLLEVAPETARGRKPDHALESIQAKRAALQSVKDQIISEEDEWGWVSIDAGQSTEDVLLAIKRSIWAAL